jgi:hypothetical protein
MGNITSKASYVSDDSEKEAKNRELMVKAMEFINTIF